MLEAELMIEAEPLAERRSLWDAMNAIELFCHGVTFTLPWGLKIRVRVPVEIVV